MNKKTFIRKDAVPRPDKNGFRTFGLYEFMGIWLCSYCKQKMELGCFADECEHCGALYKTLEEIHDDSST